MRGSVTLNRQQWLSTFAQHIGKVRRLAFAET